MSPRFWVETKPTGEKQFVLKRSHSHGHRHHHHHDHGHEYFKVDHHGHHKVTRDEWKSLLERERVLEESNIGLATENHSLKSNLAAAQADANRLSALVPQLQTQISALYADNESLRRSIDNAGEHSARHYREVERLEHKVDKLEKEKKDVKDENADLRVRLRALSRQLDEGFNRRVDDLVRDVDYWKAQCRSWKSKFDDLRHRHDVILTTLEARTEKMDAYEEILKRRRII